MVIRNGEPLARESALYRASCCYFCLLGHHDLALFRVLSNFVTEHRNSISRSPLDQSYITAVAFLIPDPVTGVNFIQNPRNDIVLISFTLVTIVYYRIGAGKWKNVRRVRYRSYQIVWKRSIGKLARVQTVFRFL